ncbi:hypothetical protein ACUOFC_65700, partial [Escherichia sp. TWPC-MK]
GMPHLPFLLFSALLGFTGWRMSKRPQAAEAEEKSLETLTRTITETSEQQVTGIPYAGAFPSTPSISP